MEACELPRATDHRRQKEHHSYSKSGTLLSTDNFDFFRFIRKHQGMNDSGLSLFLFKNDGTKSLEFSWLDDDN
ncbi:MAG: hypothetical protein ISS71_05230 [Phycisphaerae bacterium]|nr:hypothetical protein [Phycisphaerae bacterium]